MNKLRGVVVGAVVAVGIVVIAGCGSDSSSSSGSAASPNTEDGAPFVDLVDVDKTGPTKVYGIPELAGIEAAAKVVNEEGGILGHKIVVKSINDNGDPQTGSSELIGYLGSNPPPNSFYPGAESTLEGALIPIASRRGLFISGKGDGNNLYAPENEPSKNYPYGFQTQGNVTSLNTHIAEWFKEKGIKNVGVLEGEYAYAEGETPIFEKALDDQGIKHTTVKADLTATSLTPQLDQLKSAGAEGVYVALVEPSSGHVFSARDELGWDVPLVGEGSFSGTDLTKTVPASQLKDAYYAVYPNVPTNTTVPGVPKLKETIGKAKLEEYAVPIDVISLGWDTVVLLKAAAEKANSIEPAAMAEALESAGEFSDPLIATYDSFKYSKENHQNTAPKPDDFPIIPIGPIDAGQVPVGK